MHLKRYQMPRFWNLSVKKEKFVVTPRGPHPKSFSIPLQVVLRDILGLAQTSKEAKTILNQGKVLVDKKERKDEKFSVGLMDILEIPEIKKNFRVEVGTRGLLLAEVESADKKICKINNKTVVKGGKEQLNLHDGKGLLVEKKSPYKTGDSIILSLPDQKIISHLPLEKGCEVLIISGKSMGERGTITSLPERKYMLEKMTVSIDAGKKKVETLKDYVFVISGGKKRKGKA